MMPLPKRPEGVIWIDGVCNVPDEKGIEKLVAHYSRRKSLAKELEHGIAVFDDEQAVFAPAKELPLEEKWRFPHGHPILFKEGGRKWLLCGHPRSMCECLRPSTMCLIRSATRRSRARLWWKRAGRLP